MGFVHGSRPPLVGDLVFRADLVWESGHIHLNMATGIALTDRRVAHHKRQKRARAALDGLDRCAQACSGMLLKGEGHHPDWLTLLHCPPDDAGVVPDVQIAKDGGALMFANWRPLVGQSVCDLIVHWNVTRPVAQFRVSPNLSKDVVRAVGRALAEIPEAFRAHLEGRPTTGLATALIGTEDVETVLDISLDRLRTLHRSTVEQ